MLVFWELAHESRDLSQDEAKVIVVTSTNLLFLLKRVRFEKKNHHFESK